MHLERQRHLTGKFGKKGLLRPPPVRELPMLRRFIKREHCHGGRPPKTPIFRMVCKKINYRLIRPKLGNVMISKHAQDTA
jgi:hypothetical protein